MSSERIVLPSGTPAAVSRAPGAVRGVVLIPDIMGLRPLFDDLVADVAGRYDWAVIAPEPFPGRESEPVPDRLATMDRYDHARLLTDCLEAAGALAIEPVAVTGFCMGGMGALRAAATGRFDRCAAFYGMIRLPDDWQGSATDPLDDLAAAGTADRVLAVVGTADPYTPPADVDALEALGATVARYEGAEHGFVHDPARPAHRAEDAADAWARVAAWFAA